MLLIECRQCRTFKYLEKLFISTVTPNESKPTFGEVNAIASVFHTHKLRPNDKQAI